MYLYNSNIYSRFVEIMQKKISSQQILKDFKLSAKTKLLVAVSGGVDSMVLCDLLVKAKMNFSVAHCNFQLRGKNSEEDEEFIRNYCDENKIPFFAEKFNVKQYKESGNYSTQMAARELRYNWFNGLISEYQFDYLLTAHHLNDSLETFLINLSRGTGINGLKGIRNQESQILRPLLPYSKAQILQYAVKYNLQWREDKSNSETDYVRNKIRHQIVPILEEIHPQFLQNFSNTLSILRDENQIIHQHIKLTKNQLLHIEKDYISILIEDLLKLNPLSSYLHYLFSEFGFQHPDEIEKILHSENGEIQSKTHRLIKNRKELMLIDIISNDFEFEFELNPEEILEKPLYLKLLESEMRDLTAHESFDYDKIKFPLRLRKRKTGDIFFPFGMKGSKKLSKFFKDEKYSKLEKENAWLLVDDEDRIVYLVGKRMDERFKITKHTHKFLNIYLC